MGPNLMLEKMTLESGAESIRSLASPPGAQLPRDEPGPVAPSGKTEPSSHFMLA